MPEHLVERYEKILSARIDYAKNSADEISEEPDLAEQQLAAVLVKRDTYDLATSLQQLFSDESGQGGRLFSNVIFGIGVVGMTLSSISLMMLISGFIICEIFDVPPRGWLFRLGCLASANGVLWPLVWTGNAKAWLTVVAGVFGAMLLPIAYITFYFMMNSKSLMGEERPQGAQRIIWSTLMGFAALAASAAGVSAVYKKGGVVGLCCAGAFVLLVLVVQVLREKPIKEPA